MKFRQIKYLCHCVVQIKKFKPNTAMGTQCYRRQKFGHASRNCNQPARCVKCTDNHSTKDYPKKDRTVTAKCCNCNEDHPANFRQCKVRQQYLLQLKEFNSYRQLNPVKRTNNAYNDGRSWANVTSGVARPQNHVYQEQFSVHEIPLTHGTPSISENKTGNADVTEEMIDILNVLKKSKVSSQLV